MMVKGFYDSTKGRRRFSSRRPLINNVTRIDFQAPLCSSAWSTSEVSTLF